MADLPAPPPKPALAHAAATSAPTAAGAAADGPATARPPRVADPACVLSFNAIDPSGAGGLAADSVTLACIGAHPLPVACGVLVRDTTDTHAWSALDDELVADQARAVLQDMPVRAIKIGLLGSLGNVRTVSEIAGDYPDLPVITYMPDLAWWQDDGLEEYLDAFEALVLPQTWVLVGSHGTLSRWLLPQWQHRRSPSARDLARAAQDRGVPFVLVTQTGHTPGQVDNVLATPECVIGNSRFPILAHSFCGAGDTLSAALAGLLATGGDAGELGAATQEALEFLQLSLEHGFRPGMGCHLPNRMFWAQPAPDTASDSTTDAIADPAPDEAPPHHPDGATNSPPSPNAGHTTTPD